MRLVGLVVVLGIIYYAYSKRLGAAGDAPKSTDSAMKEYVETVGSAAPQSSAGSAAPQESGIKRPINTTRDVLNQVKKRNGDGEF